MKHLNDSLNAIFGGHRRAQATVAHVELQRTEKSAMAKARRLAAKHGIDIERDRANEYWVTCDSFDGVIRIDPCEGNQFCVGGTEVLMCVEAYVEALNVEPV